MAEGDRCRNEGSFHGWVCIDSTSEHKLPALLPIRERGASAVGELELATGLIGMVEQFDLVDKRELAPLDELNEAILAEDKGR